MITSPDGPEVGPDPALALRAAPEEVAAVPAAIRGKEAEQFPDWRPIFQARRTKGEPCAWDVWDIEHPAECNHFPLIRVDSKGAADDLHECIAKMIADCMNTRWAAEANRQRRADAEAQ